MWEKFDGWVDTSIIVGGSGQYELTEATPDAPIKMGQGDQSVEQDYGCLVHIRGLPSFFCANDMEEVADRLEKLDWDLSRTAAAIEKIAASATKEEECTS